MNKRGKTICASKHTKLVKKCNIIMLESIVENVHLKVLKEKQNVKKIVAEDLYSIFMGVAEARHFGKCTYVCNYNHCWKQTALGY